MTLNNMGRDHSDMGEAQQAMELDLQALAIWREVKDQRNEARPDDHRVGVLGR